MIGSKLGTSSGGSVAPRSRHEGFYRRTLECLLHEGVLDPDMSVLVVCGGEADRDMFSSLGFEDVTITNIDEKASSEGFLPYRWQHADAEDLPYEAASFDWVAVNAGLHHCRSPHRALLEMYRVAGRGLFALEARDSLLVRAAVRLKLTPEYELTAVAANDFCAGGVANTGVPNYVYRWTEREVEKTIASFAPHARNRVLFFHELELALPALKVGGRRVQRAAARATQPLLFALVRAVPRQANLFAFAVLKPELPRELHPWLRLEDGVPVADEESIRSRGSRRAGEARKRTQRDAETGNRPIRVAVVSPEPTPYRAPLFDHVAERPEIELTVIYAAKTVAGRTWKVEPRHPSVFLRGMRIPGVRRLLDHEYPVTPGVWRALAAARPDCVIVSGWSTFAAQAAVIWCRLRRVPFLLIVESHDLGPRAGWRRAVKGAIVPRIVRRSAGALVTGTVARESMVARGAPPNRIRVFANTIDVEAWSERAQRLAGRRAELRRALRVGDGDVVVLSVARLWPEKGHDTLVRAIAATDDPRLVLVLAGDGPERERLRALADELGVRLVLAGDLPHERVIEAYCAADVFALLSDREPWAVVVNEAAACGLPLVLSDRVGAAFDLLRDGENGSLVPAGDAEAAAAALRRLVVDPHARLAAGARSRELVRAWGYGPSVENFVRAVRQAVAVLADSPA
jgi:glycosyltransferase involved in cell wall biosynthesis